MRLVFNQNVQSNLFQYQGGYPKHHKLSTEDDGQKSLCLVFDEIKSWLQNGFNLAKDHILYTWEGSGGRGEAHFCEYFCVISTYPRSLTMLDSRFTVVSL